MWTLDFWLDTLERAIKTFAQAMIAGLTAGVTGLLEVQWLTVLSVSALAALVSILTSIASSPFADRGTASLIGGVEYRA